MTLRQARTRLNRILRLCPELAECTVMIALGPDTEYIPCIILGEGTSLNEELLKANGISVERERDLLWLK
jgi:hypothetical protein